jgi:SAM-dependent methyltransferase
MSVLRRLLEQWRRPTGRVGRLLVRAMNVTHGGVTDWGLAHVTVRKGDVILDVGCGGGRTVRKLAAIASEGKVYGVDPSEASVTESRRTNRRLMETGRVEIRVGAASCLPFSDSDLDLAVSINSHYYWPDLAADMKEVRRVLKPGGSLLIVGEAYRGGKSIARNEAFAHVMNIPLHTLDELRELFAAAGYIEIRVCEQYGKGWICGVGKKPSQ